MSTPTRLPNLGLHVNQPRQTNFPIDLYPQGLSASSPRAHTQMPRRSHHPRGARDAADTDGRGAAARGRAVAVAHPDLDEEIVEETDLNDAPDEMDDDEEAPTEILDENDMVEDSDLIDARGRNDGGVDDDGQNDIDLDDAGGDIGDEGDDDEDYFDDENGVYYHCFGETISMLTSYSRLRISADCFKFARDFLFGILATFIT